MCDVVAQNSSVASQGLGILLWDVKVHTLHSHLYELLWQVTPACAQLPEHFLDEILCKVALLQLRALPSDMRPLAQGVLQGVERKRAV